MVGKNHVAETIYKTVKFSVQVPCDKDILFYIKYNDNYVRLIPKIKVKGYVSKVEREGTFKIRKTNRTKSFFMKYLKKLRKFKRNE